MPKKKQSYTEQSIVSLKGADRVRKRPSVIFGSDGLDGCEQSVFEIISNSVDEAREGFGDVITVTVFSDNAIEVDDRGRGVPLGYNEAEERYNWELVYCELYAGGKYDNNSGEAAYEYSLGMNGLGACATQYASEYMDVYSYDGERVSEIHFKKGEVDRELTVRDLERRERRTGTVTRWRPDLEVFTDIAIPRDYYTLILEKQAVVNAGLKFVLRFENADGTFDQSEILYPNGISDYIENAVGDTALTETVRWTMETSGKDRADKQEYKLRVDYVFCVSRTVHMLEYFHNSSWLEHGGAPEKAVKNAFTYAIDKRLRALGRYNKNESKIVFQDVEDCLCFVSNGFSTVASFSDQTKKAVTNSFIAEAMTAFLREQLEIYFTEKPQEADKLLTQVLINKRSREQAESARINIKAKLNANPSDISSRVEKFVSCRSKDPERRELYIVEGDSAMTSCKLGRDAEFQAIIPVRGKTLNCLKSSYDKIFKSEIIVDLLRVIGCGVELPSKIKGDIMKFDYDALRWSKIIICTDADEDGFQIRTLLLTMFYRLLPTLIEKERVFIAESPLFEITAKDDIYFAYNEQEKQQIIASLGDRKYTLQRSKGLGENEPEMMWKTTMNPATRRLIKITTADAADTATMFETLLGDDLESRKRFIAENAERYMAQADI